MRAGQAEQARAQSGEVQSIGGGSEGRRRQRQGKASSRSGGLNAAPQRAAAGHGTAGVHARAGQGGEAGGGGPDSEPRTAGGQAGQDWARPESSPMRAGQAEQARAQR